ncbi:MAG: endonuclease MutS2 [Ignavibacteriaceae bacterium]|nr:endonuclease MutS2 [Ignavibacteriaceae bacterium]
MIEISVLEKLEYRKILGYIEKYCITELGKGNILNTVPFNDIKTAEYEGKLVSEAKEILIKNIPPPLDYLPDLREAIAQSTIENSVLDSKKILEILQLSIISRNLSTFLKSNADAAPGIYFISRNLFVDKVFEHHIQKVISENGEVKENASPQLLSIRKEINGKRDELVKVVNRIVKNLSDLDIVREDYLTLRDGRVVIPIKAEHKRHIRGFIHSESSTGQTVYIEPEQTLELNNEIITLSFAEKREIERILRELTKLIGMVNTQLRETLTVVSNIDSIFARAKYSIEIIGSFPSINNKKPLELKDARHPIILKKLSRERVIPLNVKIDKNKIIVITGPNAGGKTVVLKTIGIISLLLQSGMHIPAHPDSNMYFFNNILLDIGDAQSIEDDLSTFSSHLANISHILDKADQNTLVLLDEIGTGTDPAEGSALAAAILISLKRQGSIVFSSTHHGSLKIIANELEGFENGAMEFDNIKLKPTYTFKQGTPGSSYAFEVAKRIGFDDTFFQIAKEYLDTDKYKVENFLIDLETKSKKLENELQEANLKNIHLTGLTNLYQKNNDNLNIEKKEILKKIKEEGASYLTGINSKIEKVIKELKESNASGEVIKKSRILIQSINEENKNLYKDLDDLNEIKTDFKIGDFVCIINTETKGNIEEISKNKKKALLNTGKIKMQVPVVNLKKVNQGKEDVEVVSNNNYNISSSQLRLDIRGEKPEYAEFEVIKFIDTAYVSGLERVEILHGKGTGALKKMVIDLLKHHEQIRNFYFAPIEFGGEGITIAELK